MRRATGSAAPAASADELRRQHDEEDVAEERDRVDAVGQGADVVAPVAAASRCACHA
jgi:hypothetical protein